MVISQHFITKPWTEYELRGLTAKEMLGRDTVIIPDKIAITTTDKSLDDVTNLGTHRGYFRNSRAAVPPIQCVRNEDGTILYAGPEPTDEAIRT